MSEEEDALQQADEIFNPGWREEKYQVELDFRVAGLIAGYLKGFNDGKTARVKLGEGEESEGLSYQEDITAVLAPELIRSALLDKLQGREKAVFSLNFREIDGLFSLVISGSDYARSAKIATSILSLNSAFVAAGGRDNVEKSQQLRDLMK